MLPSLTGTDEYTYPYDDDLLSEALGQKGMDSETSLI